MGLCFGRRLKEVREMRGVSREELGRAAGISASTVRQIESGSIKKPPAKRLLAFSDKLEWKLTAIYTLLEADNG